MKNRSPSVPFAAAVLGLALCTLPPEAAGAPTVPADSGTVSGQVLDASTGAPLPGAHVRIARIGRDELTHDDGAFHFQRLPAGTHTLVVERLGYRREAREVEMHPGDSLHLVIALQFSAIQLPGLVVTGTVDAQLSERALRSTTALGGQELSRKLDATIAATLQSEPGLATVSTGPATARPVIRGLGGDRILLLEDGGRVGDLSSSGPDHAVSIEPVTAKQIEVVRGPAALLYGSNALGGVVNVIREEVPASLADRPHGSVSLQAQTVNRGFTGGGSLVNAFGPVALRVEASARTAADLDTPLGELENTGVETYNLSAGASWVNGWGHGGAAYRYYGSSYGVPGGFAGAHEHGVTVEMRRHTVRGETRVRSGVGPFSSVELDGTYSHYHHRELEEDGTVGTEFGLLTGVGQLVGRHGRLGPLAEGAIGVQAQWRDFAAGGSLRTSPAVEYAAAAFLLEEIELSPVRLQFGGRYDWHRVVPRETRTVEGVGYIRPREFGSASASLGVLYDIGGGVGLGASVARAYRTPDVGELFSEGPHLASYSYEVGNPDLEEEVGLGLEAFLRISRDRLKGEIAVFRNGIRNYIFPRNTGRTSSTGLPVYQHVGEDAVLTGLEGRAEWSPFGGVVLDATASFVEGTLRRTDEPLPLIPPLNGRLGVRYEARNFFVGAGWTAAARQDRVGEFEEPTDGYQTLDATAGYRWVAFGRIHSLSLRADNLSDEVYRDHLSRVKSIMPQAGRNFTLLYRVSL